MSSTDLDYLLDLASGKADKHVFVHPEKCNTCLNFEDTFDAMDELHRYWCVGESIYNVGGLEECVNKEGYRPWGDGLKVVSNG